MGGGFGGVNAALTLPTLPWPSSVKPRITLVDQSERFVFLPLLYELCVEDASLDEVAPTFRSLLAGVSRGGEGTGGDVSFLQARVEGIDALRRRVVYSDPAVKGVGSLDYDALIVATGSEISLDAVPGAAERALPFYTVEQALELKRRLALLDAYLENSGDGGRDEGTANVVVVGGGYSGVELALNLAERCAGADGDRNVQVSLVHRGERVLECATEHNRNTGLDRLEAAGVNVMTATSVVEVQPYEDGDRTDVTPLQEHRCVLQLSTGIGGGEAPSRLLAALLLWTAGATPTSENSTGVRNSVLPRDGMGRLLTSPTLNVPAHPEVFAVGDCGRPNKAPYPGTAQVAIQQSLVATWNVHATLGRVDGDAEGGPTPRPFRFLDLGEMMTLGRSDATITTLGGLVELSGPGASWLRRWVYAARMPTPRQGLAAAVDGTGRKLARSAVGGRRSKRKLKTVNWK